MVGVTRAGGMTLSNGLQFLCRDGETIQTACRELTENKEPTCREQLQVGLGEKELLHIASRERPLAARTLPIP